MSEDIMSKSMVIYKLTNLIADEKGRHKSYIGQTTRTLGERIKEHKVSKYPIGNAIRDHGWENFTVTILDECSTLEELDEREIFWIATLGTQVPNGYNISAGGEQQPHDNNKEVICLDNGMRFSSIAEAARWAGVAYPSVSMVCNGRALTAGGHRWAFANDPVEAKKPNKRGVTQARAVRCVETGEEFDSIAEAARHYNISNSRIRLAADNIEYTAADLHWQWASDPAIDPTEVELTSPRGRRQVRCIETGIIYNSITEAANAFNVSPSGMYSACNGECKTIRGLQFEFVDPNSKVNKESRENVAAKNRVPVLCVETGIRYESMKEAAESTGTRASLISAVCRGIEKTANGFHWRRLDRPYEEPTEPEIDPRWRAVRCIETGIVYNSIQLAAEALHLHHSRISAVCRGDIHSTGGFTFEYLDPNGGRIISEEGMQNVIAAVAVPVLCVETGEKFESYTAAARAKGIRVQAVSGTCNGTYKTGGGFHWRRLDKTDEEWTEPAPNPRWHAVRCIETGEVFESIAAAAKKFDVHRNRIIKVCNTEGETIAGVHLEFIK